MKPFYQGLAALLFMLNVPQALATESCGSKAKKGTPQSLVHGVFRDQWKKPVPDTIQAALDTQKPWNTNKNTDPKSWSNEKPPAKYRFLVKNIFPNAGHWENKIKPDLLQGLNTIGNQEEDRVYSTALIDEKQSHFLPAHPVGFILETDGSHIFGAYEFDRNIGKIKSQWGFYQKGVNRELEFATALMENFGVNPPEKVLTHIATTASSPWNEVVIVDSPKLSEKVRISGLVLFIVDYLPSYYSELKSIANKYNLPLVVIKR